VCDDDGRLNYPTKQEEDNFQNEDPAAASRMKLQNEAPAAPAAVAVVPAWAKEEQLQAAARACLALGEQVGRKVTQGWAVKPEQLKRWPMLGSSQRFTIQDRIAAREQAGADGEGGVAAAVAKARPKRRAPDLDPAPTPAVAEARPGKRQKSGSPTDRANMLGLTIRVQDLEAAVHTLRGRAPSRLSLSTSEYRNFLLTILEEESTRKLAAAGGEQCVTSPVAASEQCDTSQSAGASTTAARADEGGAIAASATRAGAMTSEDASTSGTTQKRKRAASPAATAGGVANFPAKRNSNT
jgi:hypothetical protein